MSERQLDVLRWIADGCPDRDWPDFTYKNTASALAGRGLVTVRRRGRRWGAAITDNGRYYLEHGVYPGQATRAPRPSARSGQPAPDVTAEQLLAQIEVAGRHVVLDDPSSSTLGARGQAVGTVIADGFVADGRVLYQHDRYGGDFRMWLEGVESHPAKQVDPAISAPQALGECHVGLALLRDRPKLLSVFADVRTLALLIARAIVAEFVRRGLDFGLRPRDEPSFRITIGAVASPFSLSEEYENREVPVLEPAAVKYPWQQVPAEGPQVWSGRLVLRLDVEHRSFFRADRQRWILQQKLPAVFREIIQSAAARVEETGPQEDERPRHERWKIAVERARAEYVEELNRERLRKQFDQYVQAEGIRVYCVQLDNLAMEALDPEQAGLIRQWAAWAREEADRIDPTSHPERLKYVADVPQSEPQEPVPFRMSLWRPPD